MTVRDRPTILHVDMDAFFVSVELLDRPELRGRPVVVGGQGERGVVAAASYEARAFGVHSAMPSVRARRLCPHAVFLAGRHARYAEVSAEVMTIFRQVTPLVEPLSLDEAFLDVAGAERRMGPAPTIAARLRARVLDEVGLTCSVGVAATKFVAKLATEDAKPGVSEAGPVLGDGVRVVAPGDTLAFLHPLPVRALWGVGPATLNRLGRLGIVTVGDLAATDRGMLVGALGRAQGQHLHDLANGLDPRPVVADRRPKSIGHEETFARDLHRRGELERELTGLSDAVAARLRAHGVAGRTITIKVRFGDFHTITRSTTLDGPVDDASAVRRAARGLLDGVDPAPGVRLLGVSVSGLGPGGIRQLSLDDAVDERVGWAGASRTVDEIRARFGADAIGPAALARPDGLDVKGPGRQQWGPGAEAAPEDVG
ncbi:DNA polymerase IV [Rhabdothermincola sp. EGI L10124]|nr:DNA polymerase IV [Rhabdothermincola salaria]